MLETTICAEVSTCDEVYDSEFDDGVVMPCFEGFNGFFVALMVCARILTSHKVKRWTLEVFDEEFYNIFHMHDGWPAKVVKKWKSSRSRCGSRACSLRCSRKAGTERGADTGLAWFPSV